MATFIGTPGNDYLPGTSGADSLSGGPGDDTYLVNDTGDHVIEAANEGYDTVGAGISYRLVLGSHVELLTTGWIAGTAAIDLTGNELANEIWGNSGINVLDGGGGNDTLLGFSGNDTLVGGAGADALFGGAGADVMFGGTGDDTFFVEDVGDIVVETANEGYDVVAAASSYTLASAAHVELMTTGWIAGTASIDLTGNDFANEIWGNDGRNVLAGGWGNDALIGFGGADYLVGGAGSDTLIGGEGDDFLSSFASHQDHDFLLGGLGHDTFDFYAHSSALTIPSISNVSATIGDFQSGVDTISLYITGNSSSDFQWIGSAAFSGSGFEVRFDGKLLEINADKDLLADLTIEVVGTVVASDLFYYLDPWGY